MLCCCAPWIPAIPEPTQSKREKGRTVEAARHPSPGSAPPDSPLHPSPSSADRRGWERKTGDLRASSGAWSGRVSGQQERGSPSVLCSPPGALAGTQGTPGCFRSSGGWGCGSLLRPHVALRLFLIPGFFTCPCDCFSEASRTDTVSQADWPEEWWLCHSHSGFLTPRAVERWRVHCGS